ncbi:MAG: hypothetical protein KAW12_04075 [Candidatus Aminicenantes bacterium]|nr:hypothetical protein [Candidatus Aminicenantes bacterium]
MQKEKKTGLEAEIKEIQNVFINYCSANRHRFFDLSREKIENFTRDFIEVFPKRPVEDNTGGGGLAPNYWLFLTARILEPGLIVESGTWRGQTSWLLRQACPTAEIHSFDINLKRLEHKDDTIFYHEQDWMRWDIVNKNHEKGLVFFDDHINQAKRVREAYERGFKRLVFDDNVPADQVDRVGIPPFPTISMIFDKELKEGDTISWRLKDRVYTYTYTYSSKDTYSAKELIKNYFVFPTYTCLTLVELK